MDYFNVKKGDTVGCHTVGFMDGNGNDREAFCIKGKAYVITEIVNNDFLIDSEYIDGHYFTFESDLNKWFYLGARMLMIEKK